LKDSGGEAGRCCFTAITLSKDPNGAVCRNADQLQAAGARAESSAALPEVADTEESMRRVLVAAREHLDMDVSFCSRLVADEEVVRGVYGDASAFGLEVDTRIALADTYSRRVIDGALPNLIPDVRRDERTAGLVPKFGSYVGVPVTFSNGRTSGMLCCASYAPAPWLRDRDVAFLRVLGRMLAHQLERSEAERAAQNHRNEAIALAALFAGLDARDSYTGRHSEAVVELAAQVTRELGMPPSFVAEVKQVALLHDVGKIGIPDAILGKPGPLDEAEWELMHEHPIIGAGIVASIEPLAHLAPAVRAEHERCDGKGYPDGLSGEQIPLASRITLACDAHHAMLSSRPYRAAMRPAAAVAELRENAGTQFDPDVVDALLSIVAH
jgi:hypothetical protein